MPKVIAYITPSIRLLGARQSLLQLVSGLDRERWTPVVICPERGGLADELEARGVTVEYLRLRPWRKGKSWPFIPGTLSKLRALFDKHNVSIVHCNEPYPVPYAVRAADGRPVVAHVRLEEGPAFAKKYSLPRANAVVCVSEYVRRYLTIYPDEYEPDYLDEHGPRIEWGGLGARVIYNGLDFERFTAGIDPERESERRREMLGIGPATTVFGQFGLLSERKAHAVILGGLRDLQFPGGRLPPDILYLVIGDEGPRDPGFRDSLIRLARECGHEVRVVESTEDDFAPVTWDSADSLPADKREKPRIRVCFLPFRKNIAPWYAAVDVQLLPSIQEGFGRVALEAAAFAKPTLGSRWGGIPEVITAETGWVLREEQHCEVFRYSDDSGRSRAVVPAPAEERVPHWARALWMTMMNSGEAEQLGKAARERAMRLFSLEHHVEQVCSLYDEFYAN